jgi:hypothetical protein
VPPPLGAAAGRALVMALGFKPQLPTSQLPLDDAAWLRHGPAEASAALASVDDVLELVTPPIAV